MYKGQLEGFPREIVERMLECQVEQGNPRDVSIFEVDRCTDQRCKGFTWENTSEGHDFWAKILMNGRLDTFFKKYPKTPYPKVMYSEEEVRNMIKEFGHHINRKYNPQHPIVGEVTEWFEQNKKK